MNELPEDKLDFAPADGARTVRQILSHIAFGDEFANAVHKGRLGSVLELDFPTLVAQAAAEEAKPRDKAALVALLTERGKGVRVRSCRRSVTTSWPSRSGCPRGRSPRPRRASS